MTRAASGWRLAAVLGPGQRLRRHLGWHEALFALESLDQAKALEVFDLYLHAEANEITLQRIDAASLLWRLQLLGADVGERWQRLLAGWALDETIAAGGSAFNDVHALIALLGAGERDAATRWMSAALANAERGGPWNRAVAREVAGPLMHDCPPSPTAASATPCACSDRSAARAAPASAAATPSATWSTRPCSPPRRRPATPRPAGPSSTSVPAPGAARRSPAGGPSSSAAAAPRHDTDSRRKASTPAADAAGALLPALALGPLRRARAARRCRSPTSTATTG
jgi:hypothetical protein